MNAEPLLIFSANDDANNYNTQGEGTLPDVTYGKASGGLSDQTLLTFQYPIDGTNVELIEENKIVLIKINEFQDRQRMRITSVKKSLGGRQYEIKAEPIFNDIRRYFIPQLGQRAVAVTVLEAFALIKNNSVPAIPSKFELRTDLSSSGIFTLEAVNALEAFAGTDGSMLDTFGGEYIRDNLTLYAYKAFGAINVTQLVYGKNIQGLDMESNIENLVIGIFPFIKYNNATAEGDSEVTLTLPEKVLNYESAATFPNGRILPVDFSDEFEDGVTPTVADLRRLSTTYMAQAVNYNKSTPLINVKIDFLELSHFSEYYNFQQLSRVGLGDTATVYYPPLGIDVETRVIKYEFDIVKQQYSKLELGQVKANFYEKLQENIKDVENQIKDNDYSGIYDSIQDAIQDASDIITGNTGGNVVISPAPPDKPKELLIMDTEDKTTAQNILRLNNSGIGFSRDGYNGLYRTAWTIDGRFNADFITAGTLKAINIEGVNITGSTFATNAADFTMKLEGGRIDWYKRSDNTRAFSMNATYPQSGVTSQNIAMLLGSTAGSMSIGLEDPSNLGYVNEEKSVQISPLYFTYQTKDVEYNPFVTFNISPIADPPFGQTDKAIYTTVRLGTSRTSATATDVMITNRHLAQVCLTYFRPNGVTVYGSFTCTGTKNSLVKTKEYGYRLLNAYETPEYLFATYNKVTTDETGRAEVLIDPAFLETINTDSENYHIFTSGYGNYNTWATDLKTDRFTIHTSEPNSVVSWNLVAYRLGYEDFYLETPESNISKGTTLKSKLEPIPESPLDVITGGVTLMDHPDKDEKRLFDDASK